MSSAMEVSVIIPAYNRAHTLKRAIDSVLRQGAGNWELIVVDDGSTDGTRECVDALRMTYLYQPNRGPSAARNLGIQNSSSEFIAFLDSDDEWLPGKLAAQLRFFEENPDSLICQTEEIWIRNGRRVNPMKKHKKQGGLIFEKCLPLCIVSPSAVMMRRKFFEEAGLFDESLPACEDYDLWLRASARMPIGFIEKPYVVKYGGHADQQSKKFPVMDRFRIQAIQKILDSGVLSETQKEAAVKELKRKCEIVGRGAAKRGKTKLVLFLLFLLLLATNRHYSFEESLKMGQTDVRDYLTLSKEPPARWKSIPFYHAQRFVVPYGLGLFSKGTGLPLEWAFRLAVALCLFSILLILFQLLTKMGISKNTKWAALLLLLFNPYFFRFYLAYPALVTDVVFILGLTLLLLGLGTGNGGALFIGAAVAGLGRQSALLLLPPFLFWIWKGRPWRCEPFRRKALFSLLVSAEVVAIYFLTAFWVEGSPWGLKNFTLISQNLLGWTHEKAAFQILLKFFVRGIFPLLFPLLAAGALLKERNLEKLPKEFFLLLIFFLFLSGQILSAGLTLAEGHLRFVLHGLVPLILAFALLLEASGLGQRRLGPGAGVMALPLFLGSLHHQISLLHFLALSNVQFGCLNLACGLVMFGGLRRLP